MQLTCYLDDWSPGITDKKIVSWPAFEALLLTKYQDINKWIEETTVKFIFINDEETKASEFIPQDKTSKNK